MRLENHHFVAGIGDRHQRCHHALGRSAADRDFALGIEIEAVAAAIFCGDRVAEHLRAPGDGVLIDVAGNGFSSGVLQDFGRGKIGETLREIHGVVLYREPAHFANHAFGEAQRSLTAKTFATGNIDGGKKVLAGSGGHLFIVPPRPISRPGRVMHPDRHARNISRASPLLRSFRYCECRVEDRH